MTTNSDPGVSPPTAEATREPTPCECGHDKIDHGSLTSYCFFMINSQRDRCQCMEYRPSTPSTPRTGAPSEGMSEERLAEIRAITLDPNSFWRAELVELLAEVASLQARAVRAERERDGLRSSRDELQSLLDAPPRPKRRPYLQGFHGRAVVEKAIAAIDAALAARPTPGEPTNG